MVSLCSVKCPWWRCGWWIGRGWDEEIRMLARQRGNRSELRPRAWTWEAFTGENWHVSGCTLSRRPALPFSAGLARWAWTSSYRSPGKRGTGDGHRNPFLRKAAWLMVVSILFDKYGTLIFWLLKSYDHSKLPPRNNLFLLEIHVFPYSILETGISGGHPFI